MAACGTCPHSAAGLVLFAVMLCFALGPVTARAASATWKTSATSGAWGTATNWSAGVPGISGGGSTSNDVATFLTSSTTTINNATAYNIGGMTFGASGSALSSFTIGTTSGNPFDLTSGGTIQIASGATGSATETINASLVIEGTSGTYTFANNTASTDGDTVLEFGGGITGANGGETVLTLGGSGNGGHLGSLSGIIANGGAASMAVTVTGSVWQLSGNNTYTGGTVVGSAAGSILSLANTNANGGSNVAIPGNLQIGVSADAGESNVVYCAAANQFSGANTVVSFVGTSGFPQLSLEGFNQSIAGLTSTYANAGVANNAYGTSILTLNGGGVYAYNGNVGDGGTLGLTIAMAGTGSQTLSGGNITIPARLTSTPAR